MEKGRGLGFGHLVEEGEVGHVLPRWGEGDDGRELVAPQDLVGQVGGAHLAGGRGGLHRGAQDDQQLEVGQVRVGPSAALGGWGGGERRRRPW